MRERVYEHYVYCHDVEARNPHCLDEMSKNHPSKLIAFHCKTNVVWLQDTVDTKLQKVAAVWSAALSEPR